MRTSYRTLTAVLTFTTLALVLAQSANADCGQGVAQKPGTTLKPEAWSDLESLSTSILYVSENDPIVGFWKVKLTAKDTPGIPDGTVIDDGFQQWHSDGTEIMNSSRVPSTGNFCLGVWKKIATSKYLLNHFGLSWDPSGNFVGPGNIRATIALGETGNKFTGTFTIDQYDTNGNLLAHLQGEVVGTRVTVHTGVGSVL